MEITKDITIEELTETVAASVKYLMEEGIRCIVCGEPIWGTLEEAAKEKGFTDTDIERFVKDLQALANKPEEEKKKTGTVINVEKLNKNK